MVPEDVAARREGAIVSVLLTFKYLNPQAICFDILSPLQQHSRHESVLLSYFNVYVYVFVQKGVIVFENVHFQLFRKIGCNDGKASMKTVSCLTHAILGLDST